MAYPPADAPARVNGDVIDASHVNALDAGVQDIVTELGTDPSGASATVQARLDLLDAASSFALIAQVITAGATGVSFTSIPTTFQHLMLVVEARSTVAAVGDTGFMRFNADATANYDHQRIAAAGGSASLSASEGIGVTLLQIGDVPGASAVAGAAGISTIMIPNYARTDFHKTYTSQANYKAANATGSMIILSYAGAWRSAAAINRIDLGTTSGGYVSGSVVSLYGMKGA